MSNRNIISKADKRRGAQSSHTRENLLDAARPLFAGQGFVGTSVRQIVKAANTSTATITYHFRDKLGLYHALLDEASKNLTAHLKGCKPEGGSTQEKLIRFAATVLGFAKSNPEETCLLFDRCVFGAQGRFSDWEVEKLRCALRSPVEQILTEGKNNGELGPVDKKFFAVVFLSVLAMACRHSLDEFTGLAPNELAEQVVRILWTDAGAQRYSSDKVDRSEIRNA